MRPAVRIALVALGLAAAVYGVASLTGGWLGTPPWWTQITGGSGFETGFRAGPDGKQEMFCERREWSIVPVHVRSDADSYWGGGVAVAGVALASFGAWPRRRESDARVASGRG